MWFRSLVVYAWTLLLLPCFHGLLFPPMSSMQAMMPPFLPFSNNVPEESNPRSIYFPGAGIYLWWQMGAVKYMQENWDYHDIKQSTLLGASAGSVSASFLLLNADTEKAFERAVAIANKYDVFSRKTGLVGVCGELMREWLLEMIPEDADMKRVLNLHVAVTGSFGIPKVITGFENKTDLVNALLASSHVPFFMDGKPTTSYKGETYLDGALWYFITKNRVTGLPFPKHVDSSNVMWVDYCDDDLFMQSVSGNFLELSSPETVHNMMEHGYNFIKKQELLGNTPFVRNNGLSLRRMSSVYASLRRKGASSLPQFSPPNNIPPLSDLFKWPPNLDESVSINLPKIA